MPIELQLYTRSGQSGYLSDAQIDANWNAIVAAFAQVNNTGGSVTQVNGVGIAGLSLAVANQTTTPYITLATTLSGFLVGTGSGFTSQSAISLTSNVSGILPIANGGTNATSLTTDRVTYFDGTRFVSSSVSSAELNSVQGVTSNIQTQLNGKEATITALPYTKGGLNGSFASRQAALNSLTAVSGASAGQVLVKSGSDAVWASPTGATQWTTTGSGIEYNGGNVTFSAFAYNNSSKSVTQSAAYAGIVAYNLVNTNTANGVSMNLQTDGSGAAFAINSYGSTHAPTATYDVGGSTWIASTGDIRWTIKNYTMYWYGASSTDIWLKANTDGIALRGGVIAGGVLWNQTTSVTVANTTTETSVVGDGLPTTVPTIPANHLQEGMGVRIFGYGYHSATGSPNITIKVKIGGVTVLSTGVVNSHNQSSDVIRIDTLLTFRTVGATGTVIGQGVYNEVSGGTYSMQNSSTTVIDTTSDNAVDITVQWGTAAAANTFTLTNLSIETIGGSV